MMKIHELITKLEKVAEKHGNLFVAVPTENRGHYVTVESVQVNKNKGESFNDYPIVELEDQAILVLR